MHPVSHTEPSVSHPVSRGGPVCHRPSKPPLRASLSGQWAVKHPACRLGGPFEWPSDCQTGYFWGYFFFFWGAAADGMRNSDKNWEKRC